MKSNQYKLILYAFMLLSVIWACKKDEDQVKLPPSILNSPELITSMVLRFTDSTNISNIIFAEFRDPDGRGGNSYTKFDSIKLSSNKTYFLNVIILDETKNPLDTISKEILKEAKDHLFCFTPLGSSAVVTITDKDENNNPVGLQSKWRTSSAGNGFMKIVLKHQANGLKNGTCSPGETDIEVNFNTKIQ